MSELRKNEHTIGLTFISDMLKQVIYLFKNYPKFMTILSIVIASYFAIPAGVKYVEKVKGKASYYYYGGYYYGGLLSENGGERFDRVEFLNSADVDALGETIFDYSFKGGLFNLYAYDKSNTNNNNTFLVSLNKTSEDNMMFHLHQVNTTLFLVTLDGIYYKVANNSIKKVSKDDVTSNKILPFVKSKSVYILDSLPSFKDGSFDELISDDMKKWKDNHFIFSKF